MYNRQKPVIEAQLSERGEDIFVASVSGIEIDERAHTYCVWPEGVDTLLPETDLVILGGGEEGSEWQLQAAWQDVFDLLGDHLQKTDAYGLPRYRTSAWPNEQQLAELKKRCSS